MYCLWIYTLKCVSNELVQVLSANLEIELQHYWSYEGMNIPTLQMNYSYLDMVCHPHLEIKLVVIDSTSQIPSLRLCHKLSRPQNF